MTLLAGTAVAGPAAHAEAVLAEPARAHFDPFASAQLRPRSIADDHRYREPSSILATGDLSTPRYQEPESQPRYQEPASPLRATRPISASCPHLRSRPAAPPRSLRSNTRRLSLRRSIRRTAGTDLFAPRSMSIPGRCRRRTRRVLRRCAKQRPTQGARHRDGRVCWPWSAPARIRYRTFFGGPAVKAPPAGDPCQRGAARWRRAQADSKDTNKITYDRLPIAGRTSRSGRARRKRSMSARPPERSAGARGDRHSQRQHARLPRRPPIRRACY